MNDIKYRKDEIMKLCTGKSVLHLGFIQHDIYEEKIKENDWLHEKIAKVSKEIVGFDYLEEHVSFIQKKYGYESYFADVMLLEKVNLEKQFDVIVCGELIEHIENPGLMLDGLKRFMHKDTIIILTTPNPWSLSRIDLINNGVDEEEWLNKEHVSWYSYQTLKQLLERKGFQESCYDYYYAENKNEIYKNCVGYLGKLKILRRKYIRSKVNKKNYDGLFFVAKQV